MRPKPLLWSHNLARLQATSTLKQFSQKPAGSDGAFYAPIIWHLATIRNANFKASPYNAIDMDRSSIALLQVA
ncbi:MAG: hypothetical protein CMM07_29255 [Rhodopirellula sp.]|nr:hypothetical protein [Rhodopirellula sp.]